MVGNGITEFRAGPSGIEEEVGTTTTAELMGFGIDVYESIPYPVSVGLIQVYMPQCNGQRWRKERVEESKATSGNPGPNKGTKSFLISNAIRLDNIIAASYGNLEKSDSVDAPSILEARESEK